MENFLLTWGTEGTGPGRWTALGVVGGQRPHLCHRHNAAGRCHDLEGNQIDQFGGFGGDPGKFIDPFGIALDYEGISLGQGNARIHGLDRFEQTLDDRGDGGVLATGVGEVYYLDIDASGRIYAADHLHGKLLVFDPRRQSAPRARPDRGIAWLGLVTGVAVDAERNVGLPTRDTITWRRCRRCQRE
ncbi:MAG: hypothetical protein R2848_00940 [Thermomicrobiales bacterium]